MVRTNLFGELIHCRCGYEHDLRGVKFDVETNNLKIGKEAHSEAQWRGLHAIKRNGDLYLYSRTRYCWRLFRYQPWESVPDPFSHGNKSQGIKQIY